MADWQWQEALQSLFIGVVFAYMCGRLFTLISSIRGQKFRLERGEEEGGAAAALLATYDEREYAPADERNVPYTSLEEDDGGDEHEGHGEESESSSEDEFDYGGDRGAGAAAVGRIVSDDEDKPKDVIEDVVPDSQSDEKAAISGRDSLKVLTNEEPEDAAKESEGNETDDWEGVESTELEELFGAASTYVASMVSIPGVKPSSEAMLQLYAYYKIATEGPCSTSQPSAFQPTARAKWNAWQKLGNLPQEEAMQKYVGVLTALDPTWHQSQQKNKDSSKEVAEVLGETSSQSGVKRMGPGPVFSSLVMNEDGGEEESTMDPLHACARDGDVEGLAKLVDQGSSINVKDSDGRTPLIWAVDRGNLSAVEILVAKGAEINAKDQEGQTALHYATVCDQEEVAKYLFEHGADINIPDNEGNTPLSQCPPHWLWLQRATG
ncbi:hypothetical protein KC19_5G098100 [Ceratodon purpureus]|uniref:ACB domain-containing protein n=1 Tax=Ceratodon purpureus TaxID=3225 RepID=A0A8T0HZR3_CERPU|nr:hypothetical protein KC19_5G098100 [Ceratodon purpureus]